MKNLNSGVWEWWIEVKELNGNTEITRSTLPTRRLYIDQTPPTGAFTVLDPESGQVLDQFHPTNSQEVTIELSDLSDQASDHVSGLKEILIWNESENREIKVTYAEYLAGTTSIPWRLTSEDGLKRINVKILDEAG